MEERLFALPEATSIAIELQTIDRLVAKGDGDCALLYFYLLKTGGNLQVFAASAALKKSAQWITDTAKKLYHLDLLQEQTVQQAEKQDLSPVVEEDEPPQYTAEEIAKELEGQSPFPELVKDTQQRIGRVLSTTDLKLLFGLYDYLDLPAEVISLLITYCMEEARRQLDGKADRPLRMRQVEREAYRWKRLSVDTPERAEAYLKEMETRRSLYTDIFEALQLPPRAPSPSERKYMDQWMDMGFPVEVVALAYDKTMIQTGALKWPYLNSILKRWHQKNLHTLDEIHTGDTKSGFNKGTKDNGVRQEQERKAEKENIAWMKELVKKQKQDS